MTIEQMLDSALDHHKAGRLTQAEQLYRAILAQQPDHADALHLLGVLANQTGHHADACEWIGKALAVRPAAEFYFNLAGARIPLGQFDRAIDALRQAIALKPDFAAAYANLGACLQSSNQFDQAIHCFEQAIALEPGNPEFHYNLGNALMQAQSSKRAIDAYTVALRIKPDHVDAMNNLASALHAHGRFDEAEKVIRDALIIKPRFPQALNNLGNILFSVGRFEEAAGAFLAAIDIEPHMPLFHNNLANALAGTRRYTEAIDAYRQGISLQPVWPEAHNNLSVALRLAGDTDGAIVAAEIALSQKPHFDPAAESLALALQKKGELDRATDLFARLAAAHPDDAQILSDYGNVLQDAGRLGDAIAAYQQAMRADPSDARSASSYLFTLQFFSDDADLLLAEYRKWNQQFAAPLHDAILPLSNDRNADRPLRIGYVSPDFRQHCQALFTTPLLSHHDREQFKIFCYSAAIAPDAVTVRLQAHVDVWRNIATMSDAAAAELIRADGIDILVDLTMHMSYGRPLIFARKPAPVQVAWLAYPGTSGLASMDYRLTDPYLDPPGFERRYVERSVHLPDTFWCYDPHGMDAQTPQTLPEPGELPAAKNGFITFGCLNNFFKINHAALTRWGHVMQSIPRSRLHLLAPRGRCRGKVLLELQPFGIGADRIEFVDRKPRPAYLAEYRRIDLCLDTLPYNGHTTSLDAFWMGVPVLTQIGKTVVGRAGWSQLSNLQLPDFAAADDEQFIQMVRRHASDLFALTQIRRTLRDRISASPLMDAKKFTRNMERSFRQMWRQQIEK